MAEVTLGRNKLRTAQVGIACLAAIIMAFAISRLINDVPHVVNGTIPEEDVDREYVAHPWLAYLHVGLAIVYLLGAPIQLAYRIRSKHYTFHRRLGRVLLVMGLLCGIFAVIFGAFFSFGGPWQAPDLLSFPDSFAAAFWISFALHAAFAEWWIRTTPHPPG